MPAGRLGGEIGPGRRVVGDLPCADDARRGVFEKHVGASIAIEVAHAGDAPSRRLGGEVGPGRRVVDDFPRADDARRCVFEKHVGCSVAIEIMGRAGD